MRILFLAGSFNSLTQRLWVELEERGHALSLELDVNDAVTAEAVRLFRPGFVIASFLQRALPETVWRQVPCLVVHPGPVGDRGPSSLDRAIMADAADWGVTLLQAEQELDAGPVWASRRFAMRPVTKSSLYRQEVTEAAVACVLEAIGRVGQAPPERRAAGPLLPRLRPDERAIDWRADDTATVLRRIRAADGAPGVPDELLGLPVRLFDAHPEDRLRGRPGAVLAQRDGAICRATVDGAVWIGHVRPAPPPGERSFKMTAAGALGDRLGGIPDVPCPAVVEAGTHTWREITYRETGAVGWLGFAFYNGAMSTDRARRLLRAYERARRRPTSVLVLEGGPEFWSNGMDLAAIEAAASPAEASWANINAIDDLAQAIITTTDKITIAAMSGNAGAGGAFLALAADRVLARDGVILNPHYKNMGNLYGSEFWTYLLPRRCGDGGMALVRGRLPLGARAAQRLGLVDEVHAASHAGFAAELVRQAQELATDPAIGLLLREKARRRAEDEAKQPLATYRAAELARMRLNFWGFDPSYHVARYHFVTKHPPARTPFHLARHRTAG